MTPLIHDDFLLETEVARDLYHRVARDLPIIDYHGHLPADRMASDRPFRSIAEICKLYLSQKVPDSLLGRISHLPSPFLPGIAPVDPFG